MYLTAAMFMLSVACGDPPLLPYTFRTEKRTSVWLSGCFYLHFFSYISALFYPVLCFIGGFLIGARYNFVQSLLVYCALDINILTTTTTSPKIQSGFLAFCNCLARRSFIPQEWRGSYRFFTAFFALYPHFFPLTFNTHPHTNSTYSAGKMSRDYFHTTT